MLLAVQPVVGILLASDNPLLLMCSVIFIYIYANTYEMWILSSCLSNKFLQCSIHTKWLMMGSFYYPTNFVFKILICALYVILFLDTVIVCPNIFLSSYGIKE